MSGEVNRVPVSLMSLLDMTARGQAPRLLSGELQAGIDLLEPYLQQGRVTIQAATNAINADGWWLAFTVPDYTAYWMHGLSFTTSATLPAATFYKVRPAYTPDGQPRYLAMPSDLPSVAYQSGTWPNVPAHQVPRILMPGAQVGVWCEDVTLGTAQQWIAWADLTPLRV